MWNHMFTIFRVSEFLKNTSEKYCYSEDTLHNREIGHPEEKCLSDFKIHVISSDFTKNTSSHDSMYFHLKIVLKGSH